MIELTRRAERIVTSLGLLVALFGALPAALVAVSGARFESAYPLAGVPPVWRWDLARIRSAASEPLAESAVVDILVRASLVIIWLAVGVMVVTTVAEIVHMIRHRGIGLPAVRGLGWAQPVARMIAIGLIAIAPHSPRVSLASATGDPAPYQVLPHLVSPAADIVDGRYEQGYGDPPSGEAEVAEDVVHVVRRGESVYSIASDLAGGDPGRTVAVADAILDANLGRTMAGGGRFTNPAYIEVGWRLTIPAEVGSAASAPFVADGATVHVVAPGDTLSGIAEVHLGDPDAWPAIWEANAGLDMGGHRTFDDPDLILPGWSIGVPDAPPANGDPPSGSGSAGPVDASASVGSDETVDRTTPMGDDERPTPDVPASPTDAENETPTAEVASTPTASATATDSAPTSEATSRAADTATTSDATSTGADTATTSDATSTGADTATTSDATSTAPDSAGSAATAELPSTATNPPATAVASDTAPDTAGAPPGLASTTDPSGTEGTEVAVVPTSNPRDVTEAHGTTASTSTTTTTDVGASPSPAPEPAGESGVAPVAPSPIRLEQAAMVVAGVLAVLGVRRRQRLRSAKPRSRVPEPRAAASAMERRLRLVDPGERSQRVDVALRAASSSLVGTDVQVGLVMVGVDGTVGLQLTGAATLPAPWTGAGPTWELPAAVPIEVVSEAARLVGTPCLALAQLGVSTEGCDVLVDLEACPTLVVEGHRDATDDIIAGIATSLAASPYAEVAHVVTVSVDDAALLDHRNAHRADSADAALELATSLVGARRADLESSFALRSVRTGGEVWEPAVVVLRASDSGADEIAAAPAIAPGSGIAIVAAVDEDAIDVPGCRLRPAEGGWVFDGFGASVPLAPVGMSARELDEIAQLLGAASAPLEQPDDDQLDPADALTAPAGSEPEPFVELPHAVVVGLLGEIQVVDAEGVAGSFERSKTVELLAWLATHRERSTRTAARTALWDLDVRDATFANVVSEARRALARLVPPPHGEEWLARTLNEQLPLHGLVVTDAQLIEHRLDAARRQPPAQAIDTLRPAVERVRGVPFAGTSYLWPDAEGITSSLVLLAIGACAELADQALSVGDVDTVFWATGRGLAVLPGHEELIARRMQAHARAGDYAGVRHEWESYERVIVADTWSDGEPAPKLVELRRELLS